MGVLGFVPEPLELGDVRDVLDTCDIAQASDKAWKTVAEALRNGSTWRIGEDEATRYDTK